MVPASAAQSFTRVRVWGQLTDAESQSAAEQVLPHLTQWSRLLVDAAHLENASESLTRFLRSSRSSFPADVRQAAVIGPRAAAPARTWVRVMNPRSAGVQAFASEEQALAWLLSSHHTTSGGS